MSDPIVVRYEVQDGVAVITIDNPPVNALGPGVAEGITASVDRAGADPAVRAAVLIGAGRTFIAGADIRGFGTGRPRPVRRSYDALDGSGKPVVAAIHGFALGGGLEHAMACHYRVAVSSALVGLPEVKLGIIPGGGGTQRLPRLVGVGAALDMITSGRHVPAPEALAMGLLDEMVEGDLLAGAIRFAQGVAERRPLPRARDRAVLAEAGVFEAKRRAIARGARNQRAPYACIEAVEACTLPFDEGIARERTLFAELENSEEARALRYAFFAEREVGKIPGLGKDVPVRAVREVAVIGAGTMGSGIAMALADHGMAVKLMEASPEALERGMARVRETYAVSVRRGSLDEAAVGRRLALIEPAASYEAIGGCDAVIEAVFEELDAKIAVFTELDRVMKSGALLLTNTSALSIDAIAAATARPGDVAGAHFFSPANVMKLLEVVAGPRTAPETLASVLKLGRAAGKVAAVAHDCDGFAANRSRAPFNAEMVIMLEEGALPQQVDKVMVEFGYPMGPFAVGDLAGLDIGYAARRRRAAQNPAYRSLPIADRLVEAERKGQKTGAGWYRYEKGDRTPYPDPVVEQLIEATAAELGVARRGFTDEEILHRLLFASVNEACRLLEEGIIYRASDLDAMWLNGFGFPRYRGGLMFWADAVGARAVHDQVAEWHGRYGARWAPSPVLAKLAESGGLFREAVGREAVSGAVGRG